MEDKRIIELFWQRDEAAIQAAKTQYGAYCYTVAMQILQNGEDASECENDAYWRAWESIPPDRPRELRAYLGAVTRRLALDRWRQTRADKRGGGQVALSLEELGECVPDGSRVEQTLEGREAAALLSDFLRSLPRLECDVFLRRYWYLDSVEQIARRYGFTGSKVKMMLKRTRDKLRTTLEKEGIFV